LPAPVERYQDRYAPTVRRVLVLVPVALLLVVAAFLIGGSYTVSRGSSSPETGGSAASLPRPSITADSAWCRSAFTTVVFRATATSVGDGLRMCMPEAHHRLYVAAAIGAGALALAAVALFVTRRRGARSSSDSFAT
jgi:hypothetical protein